MKKINKLDIKLILVLKFSFKLAEIVKSTIDATFRPYDGFLYDI